MQSLLTRWADALLAWLGLTSALNNGWDRWVAFALVVLSVVLLDFLCRTVLVRGIRRIVMRTKATWDDELFSSAVLSRLCNIVSAIVLVIVLPVVFDEQSEARTIVTRLIQVYIVVTVFRFINALLYAAFNIVSARPWSSDVILSNTSDHFNVTILFPLWPVIIAGLSFLPYSSGITVHSVTSNAFSA